MELDQRTRVWFLRMATAAGFLLGAFLFFRVIDSVGVATIREHVTQISLGEFLLLVTLPIITLGIASVRLWMILRALGQKLSLPPLFLITSAGFSLGYLFPLGGLTDLSTRALLLSRAGLPTRTALLGVITDGFLRLMVNSVLLFVVAGYLVLAGFGDMAARPTLIAGFVVGGIALSGMVVLLSQGTARYFARTAKRLGKQGVSLVAAEEAFMQTFRAVRPFLVGAALVTAAGFFWESVQMLIILKFLGITLPFWQVFWLYHALLFPQLLPIPGGLGVSEAGGSIFAQFVGLGSNLGLAVVLLARLRALPYVLLGLIILPFAGFITLKNEDDAPHS
jgi:uncharacterized protein (TIRG00374 family)